MAVRTATRTKHISAKKWTWSDIATGDTINPVQVEREEGGLGSVQFTGAFGGATVTLEASNDGTNFVTLKDVFGTDVSVTAAGMHEISTGALYLRPGISGGSSDAVDVTLVLRINR